MNIIYHLDMAIETLQAIAPKQYDSYVDGEIKHIIDELEIIKTYVNNDCEINERLEFLHNEMQAPIVRAGMTVKEESRKLMKNIGFDPVEKPSHYNQGKYEVIDVIEDWDLDFHEGNVIKYVARHKFKANSLGDLKKARYYLERKIERVE